MYKILGGIMSKVKKIKGTNFKFKLGDRARDMITGCEGIITRRTQWLNNCNTYGLQSSELKDGAPQDPYNLDEPQIELVEEKVHKASRSTGGPNRAVP